MSSVGLSAGSANITTSASAYAKHALDPLDSHVSGDESREESEVSHALRLLVSSLTHPFGSRRSQRRAFSDDAVEVLLHAFGGDADRW